jgi:hypothetical protein
MRLEEQLSPTINRERLLELAEMIEAKIVSTVGEPQDSSFSHIAKDAQTEKGGEERDTKQKDSKPVEVLCPRTAL